MPIREARADSPASDLIQSPTPEGSSEEVNQSVKAFTTISVCTLEEMRGWKRVLGEQY